MKTKFLVSILAGIILSTAIGYWAYLDEPKTPADCRKKYGKVKQDIEECIDRINNPGFFSIPKAFASCVAEVDFDLVLENSEMAFTGTVTRLDNYGGPQRVTFLIHDIIKGDIPTQKFIFENSGMVFLEDGSIASSSNNVDYKIGKTYKVYVENGNTSRCTTMITAPPAGYVWEPGPEDGNYYSEDPQFVNPCEEGYGLSDGVCITLEEMNKDLPTCSANPKHDFGKCRKNTQEPPNTFEQVRTHCDNGGEDVFLEWWNDEIYYNNADCEILYRDSYGGPPPLVPEPKPDEPIPQRCGPGAILQDGICIEKTNTVSVDNEKWSDPYDDESIRLASNKVFGGTGISFSDELVLGAVVISIAIGVSIAVGMTVYWRRRK